MLAFTGQTKEISFRKGCRYDKTNFTSRFDIAKSLCFKKPQIICYTLQVVKHAKIKGKLKEVMKLVILYFLHEMYF